MTLCCCGLERKDNPKGEIEMLFVVNKVQPNTFQLIRMLGGEEEKAVLLVQDAVYYATPPMVEKLKGVGVEEVYVARDGAEARNLKPSQECAVVDYGDMADLIMDEYDKVLSI